MIQISALRLRIWLCHFKISTDTSAFNHLITVVIRIMQIQLYRDFGPIVSSNHVSATEKESQKKEEVISGKQWTKLGENIFLSISDKKESWD